MITRRKLIVSTPIVAVAPMIPIAGVLGRPSTVIDLRHWNQLHISLHNNGPELIHIIMPNGQSATIESGRRVVVNPYRWNDHGELLA